MLTALHRHVLAVAGYNFHLLLKWLELLS
jgi:hypothetical protein